MSVGRFSPVFFTMEFLYSLGFYSMCKRENGRNVETTGKANNIHMNVISIDLISELACASELEWNQII